MRVSWSVAAVAAAMGCVCPAIARALEMDVATSRETHEEEPDFEAEARFGGFDQSVVVGRAFGDHVSLLTGLSFSLVSLEQDGSSGTGWFDLRIPIELKVSLRRPDAGVVVPIVRVSTWVASSVPIEPLAEVSRGMGGGLFAGATYFVSRSFGAGVDAGFAVDHRWTGDHDTTWLVTTLWRGHLVLRV